MRRTKKIACTTHPLNSLTHTLIHTHTHTHRTLPTNDTLKPVKFLGPFPVDTDTLQIGVWLLAARVDVQKVSWVNI